MHIWAYTVDDICPFDITINALYGNYSWPSIGGGSDYTIVCVYVSIDGQEGAGAEFARRSCNTEGRWEAPDFSDCQNSELV